MDFILSLRTFYKDIPILIRKTFLDLNAKDFLNDERENLYKYIRNLKNNPSGENYKLYLSVLKIIHTEAKNYLKEKDYFKAAVLYLIILEATLYDDLGIDHIISSQRYNTIASDALYTLSNMKYSINEKKIIFKFLKVISSNFPNRGEITSLLKIMYNFVKSQEDFTNYLDILVSTNLNMRSPALKHELYYLQYNLLKSSNNENKAMELLMEHKEIPGFMIIRAKECFLNNNYNDGLNLALKGLNNTKNNVSHQINFLQIISDTLLKLKKYDEGTKYLIKLLELGEYSSYLKLKTLPNFTKIYDDIISNEIIRDNPKGVYQRILYSEEDSKNMVELIKRFPHMIKEYFDFIKKDNFCIAIKILYDYIVDNAKGLNSNKKREEMVKLVDKLYSEGTIDEAIRASDIVFSNNLENKFIIESLLKLKNEYLHQNIYIPE